MHTVIVRVRESFWFLPAVFGIGAVILAELLVLLDQRLLDGGISIPFLDALSASGGRSILTTIGTSMLTVAGTSFSITISVLATTSSTYGPRLVRNFMADRANQLVLAAFTSTFLYAIVVLRSVHTDIDDGTAFVPLIAVHVAVLLGIVDVAVLVFFIHHIASSTQITSLQNRVQTDLAAALDQVYRPRDEDGLTVSADIAPDQRDLHWETLSSLKDGYVQSIHWKGLVAWAAGEGCVVDVVAMPGVHVIAGDALVRIGRVESGRPGGPSGEEARVQQYVALGSSRTPVQDVEFALQQLIDSVVRGLASGTNDPYTAVSGLDLAASALVPMWRDRYPIAAYLDGEGNARVRPRWPAAEALIERVFDSIRIYGMGHPTVEAATRRLARRLDEATPPGRRSAVLTEWASAG